MKKLFYVRHGETHVNVSDLLSGRTETPLTEKEVEQATAAGKPTSIGNAAIVELV